MIFDYLQLAYGDESGPDGEVWSTYSFISNFFFGIFFSPQLSKKYIFRPEDMGIPVNDQFITRNIHQNL